MLGQLMCGIGQSFTLSVPSRLSALWFESSKISTATSIGIFANQLGTAIGFLVPPNLVKIDTIENMQTSFYYLLIPVAALSGVSTVLAFLFISDQPPTPPSLTQLEIQTIKIENTNLKQDLLLFKQSLVNLFKNLHFILMLITYGINTGIFYSISTLLNQIINEYYPVYYII